MVNAAAKLLSRLVSQKVQKGMDIIIGSVTLPHMRHPMEWGEAVEGLADAVVDNHVNAECPDIRRTGEFLSHRILRSLQDEMKEEKQKMKIMLSTLSEEHKDFYVPSEVNEDNATNVDNKTV